MQYSFIFRQITYCLSLFITFQVGELSSKNKYVAQNLILRCVADNVIHIALGIFSWLIVISYDKLTVSSFFQSILCGILAGVIDIDHFMMAKSIYLRDAVSLPSRPPFHNTTVMTILILGYIFVMHEIKQEIAEKIGWFLLVAVVSHHLRDAMHRGLWIWPYDTRVFSFCDSFLLSYLIPLAVGAVLKIIHAPTPKEKPLLDV